MAADFDGVFAALKPVLGKYAKKLTVKSDTAEDYTLVTKSPSPFPQHKGHPLWFGAVKKGKAYVSLHVMPLYMHPELTKAISPELKKRMQGKACFNFKAPPEPALIKELSQLAGAAVKLWSENKWL